MSDGSATRDQPISETCSSPCTPPPRSTNAPKSRTETTRPVTTAPTVSASANFLGARPLLGFEQRASRHDELPSLLVILDDAERIDAAEMRGRISVADRVDLRPGTEGALLGHRDAVAALHLALDLAFDGQPGAKRVFELTPRRGAALQAARERQAAVGRHDGRLDAIADLDVDHARRRSSARRRRCWLRPSSRRRRARPRVRSRR